MRNSIGREETSFRKKENSEKQFWLWLLLLIMPISCYGRGTMSLSGTIIYTAGADTIKALDLSIWQSFLLYKKGRPYGTRIEYLTKTAPNQILFDECPSGDPCVIKEFTIDTKETKTWRSGLMPTYVSQDDSVFFYEATGRRAEYALFVAKKTDPLTVQKIATAPAPQKLPNGLLLPLKTPVVQIAPEEIVFVGEDYQLWVYQITQRALLPTGIETCLPQTWRSKTQRLLCYDWNSWDLYEIDVKTKEKEVLSSLKGSYGLLYIADKDVLIYGKTRSYMLIAETADLFAYSFETEEKIKLEAHTGMRSGVWLP